jgi:hypothetical protein
MKAFTKIVCTCALLALAVGVPAALAGDPAGMGEEQMKNWMEAMTPGEAHQFLQTNLAGDWEFTMRSFEDPANPMESKGTSTKTVVYDRYLMEKVKSSMMGQPFEGTGVLAYNNVEKRYEGVWFDNMGTGIGMAMGGKFDGKTIEMTADFTDPATREASQAKWITKIVSKDKHTFEWHKVEGGKSMKMMEIEYVRAGVSHN